MEGVTSPTPPNFRKMTSVALQAWCAFFVPTYMAGLEASASLQPKRPFRKNIAAEGDTVIVTYCKNEIQLIKLRRGATTQSKCGAIKHNDVIGKPYGSRIATSVGRVNILALDPAIWAISVPHRTQIIYPIDASMIVGQLDLVPGCRVLEAGTGSGALTHALAQAVWPTGHVSTFDFHQERVERAVVEFEEHGLKDVVSVEHRDVLSDGFPEAGSQHNPEGCHAIMIDLPEPWVVIPTIAKCFALSGGRVCVFSPCIEQVQKTCENLRSAGFLDVEVIECISRNYDPVHTVLNVPNLGQDNATDLFNGTYTYKKAQVAEAPGTDSGADKRLARRNEPHLFPPLSNYLTLNENPKGNGQGYRQYGYWAALPRQKDTGHTGYLTFASSIPMTTSVNNPSCDVDNQGDAVE
ncbi:tRNA (adenine(58)-N(1))-methyltransferase catalytic subunit TRMT61A [Echinococcus granulosus]|uniref:tRNA (adenine(58)-N(1))-methyltransferase catalytic subunit TRMT61A n=1 Tax=Echinococcus granulosus TaxID=6210 RepID=A0A068WTT7_ECHGR|nr:tRNA (adenine(58)-N(1))-methyltransferase catalytic subunit TRMT61A [Echinococcus granulosus]CDS21873.1 tRNA adenine N1 methyltransferase catalytic [Echinococcus granulosus]